MEDFHKIKSFGQVDEKVAEADFFLKKFCTTQNLYEARFYFSAFATASRSITFTMQYVMKEVKGFGDWYIKWQGKLKSSELAKKFLDIRNHIQKRGVNPIDGGSFANAHYAYHSRSLKVDNIAVYCKKYLTIIIECVWQCYVDFGRYVDPHMYYTKENYENMGLSVEDAEKELWGDRGWTVTPFLSEEHRWAIMRASTPGCQIKNLFLKYLGKYIPEPKSVELPESCDEKVKHFLKEKGYHYNDGFWLPANVEDVNSLIKDLRINRTSDFNSMA